MKPIYTSLTSAAVLSFAMANSYANSESLHHWPDYIDIERFGPNQKAEMTNSLNWLEDNFAGFTEILWNLKDQNEKQGLSRKVPLLPGAFTARNTQRGFTQIAFTPDFVIGSDQKLYRNPFEANIVHELQHDAQRFYPEIKATFNDCDIHSGSPVSQAYHAAYKELEAYLESKDIPHRPDGVSNHLVIVDFQNAAFGFENEMDKVKKLAPEIYADAEYQNLAKNYFDSYYASFACALVRENDAMDKADQLRGMLGIAQPRGHYYLNLPTDPPNFQADISDEVPEDMFILNKLSEAEIIEQGNNYEDVPNAIKMTPALISGAYNNAIVSAPGMIQDWQKEFNTDTVNIDHDEWRAIDATKMAFFKEHPLPTLTDMDRAAFNALIEPKLVEFNTTPIIEGALKPMNPKSPSR